MKSNLSIITAEINMAIHDLLLSYQKKGNISNTDMYLAIKEIAESFERKNLIDKYKEKE